MGPPIFPTVIGLAVFTLLFCAVTTHAAATYYVSQSMGNDANDGIHSPWKTLTKASQTTFTAGDRSLLKCGDTWNRWPGTQREWLLGRPGDCLLLWNRQ